MFNHFLLLLIVSYDRVDELVLKVLLNIFHFDFALDYVSNSN